MKDSIEKLFNDLLNDFEESELCAQENILYGKHIKEGQEELAQKIKEYKDRFSKLKKGGRLCQ